MEPIRIVIAEDDSSTREALAELLGLTEGIRVVGVAADGNQAIGLTLDHAPDVLLTDIEMPGHTGISVTQRVKRVLPQLGVVVLTIFHDDANVFAAIKAGAMGYVLKDSPAEEIVEAIRAVARGESLLSSAIAARVLSEFNRITTEKTADLKLFSTLTAREVEILKEVATGKRNRAIGEGLFISEKTVKNHISSILFKLHLNDRTEAAMLAARQGLV